MIKKTSLVAAVVGLIIGAAIFIYVASSLLQGLKTAYMNSLSPPVSNNTGATPAAGAAANASRNASVAFNTSVDSMITISYTVGSLMGIAAVALVGFWIVKDVIGGG